MNKLLIIDFYNLMHRAFHAYPKTLTNGKGLTTNAIYGFVKLLLKNIEKQNPTHVMCAFEDNAQPTIRSTNFSSYKKNRKWAEEKPEEAAMFYTQLEHILEILNILDIKYIKCDGYEADDVAGTLATRLQDKANILILSNDQDLLQLVNPKISVLRPARPPFVKETIYTPNLVKDKFGFEAKYINQYKGLRGDPSDNIPGVRGVGEKTATDLIKQFKTVEDTYKNIDKIEKERTKKLLLEGYEDAILSADLATIEIDCPIKHELKEFNFNKKNIKELNNKFKDLGFNSLIKQLGIEKVDEMEKEIRESLF